MKLSRTGPRASSVVGLVRSLSVKVYPNGEAVVWRNKVGKAKPVDKQKYLEPDEWKWECWQLYLHCPEALQAASLFMGLSLVSNFDKLASPLVEQLPPGPKKVKRYGGNGITRKGARTVRNAAYLLEKESGPRCMTFATLTVPPLPLQQMCVLHENWSKLVELYRLAVRRVLTEKGLSGEIVSVSEIQEKRYEKTGLPVLHLHSVFRGRLPYGGWALNTEVHDKIVRQVVQAVVGPVSVSFKSAANLQEVHSSASGYLGKYMSKGASVVKNLREKGYGGWLPRQWWNCSRSLTQRVQRETIRADDMGEFLLSATMGDNKDIWKFHGTVSLDIGESQPYWLATYGRLNPVFLAELREYVNWTDLTECATLPGYKP